MRNVIIIKRTVQKLHLLIQCTTAGIISAHFNNNKIKLLLLFTLFSTEKLEHKREIQFYSIMIIIKIVN